MSDNNTQLAVSAVNKGGRPSKYKPETVDRLLAAIADGLTLKQASAASSISENTLYAWRERHPELEPRLQQAREQARQKALAGIKAAGEASDWRALEAFLRMSFQADYRQGAAVNVTATATAQSAAICTEEQRKKLIEMREKLLSSQTDALISSADRFARSKQS
jgi:replicative superfamily II helicase